MNPLAQGWRKLLSAALVAGIGSFAEPAAAQDSSRVSAARALRVEGLSMAPHAEDLLGISRVKFQGLIASQLAAVGYRLAEADALTKPADAELAPLTLVGEVKEEICDDAAPSQCRIAIQWELQDTRGLALYRTTTRAVEQAPSLDKLRRALVEGALRSLMQRRRFALQLTTSEAVTPGPSVEPLGFKQCRRTPQELPAAARAVTAGLVLIQAGSNLTSGAIISGDGLILTNARTLDERAPLRVRFSAQQVLSAKVVALDRAADVALLHVAAQTGATCIPLADAPLSAGMPVFGVSSELSEEHALSLAGGVVQPSDDAEVLRVDALIARGEGGPLLDQFGRLVGVVVARHPGQGAKVASAISGAAALAQLELKPAAVTDPRLVASEDENAPAVGFVQDHDDPPFVLTKRYTYGTSGTAHSVRTAGAATAVVGGVVGAWSWLNFRGAREVSPSHHQRLVVINDIGWVLLGVGLVGVGVSYALPEGHDVVAAHSVARRDVYFGVSARGVELGGHI